MNSFMVLRSKKEKNQLDEITRVEGKRLNNLQVKCKNIKIKKMVKM